MVSRPEGQRDDTQKSSRELGLREMAKRAKTDRPVACLKVHIESPAGGVAPTQHRKHMRAMLADITWPDEWNSQQRARALWNLIVQEIKEIGDGPSRTRAAVRVCFGLDNQYRPVRDMKATIAQRLEEAQAAGIFPGREGLDWPRQLWTEGVIQLAHAVDERLAVLAEDPSGWESYHTDADASVDETGSPGVQVLDAPELAPLVEGAPFYMQRMIATYLMKRRCVSRRTTEMWVTSRVAGLDHYNVRTWSYVGGEPVVQTRSWLNCRTGELRSVTSSTQFQIIECPVWFPEPLKEGQDFFFATENEHLPTDTDETPVVEIEVTCQGIAALAQAPDGTATRGLTMRLQFDTDAWPGPIWWFANMSDLRRFDKPPEGDPRRLDNKLTTGGYLEHTFVEACRPHARYGVAWEWA